MHRYVPPAARTSHHCVAGFTVSSGNRAASADNLSPLPASSLSKYVRSTVVMIVQPRSGRMIRPPKRVIADGMTNGASEKLK